MKIAKNQVWLITGAASGIGKLMAEALLMRETIVVLVDINKEALIAVEKDFLNRGFKAHAVVGDLSKPETFLELKQEIHSRVGKIHGLINNAGVVFGGEFEKVEWKKHALTYQINTLGPVGLTHAFMPDFLEHTKNGKDVHVVNIASASGFVGLPYGSTYAASKWAMIGFSDSLRLEVKERGLYNFHVTTVCPSYIATGMFQGVRAPLMLPWLKPEEIVLKILRGIEMDKAFIREPFLVKTIDLLKGIMPQGIYDAISKFLGVTTSMYQWRGRN